MLLLLLLGVPNFTFFRWLVNKGRDDEALAVLSKARNMPPDSDVVQIEFL